MSLTKEVFNLDYKSVTNQIISFIQNKMNTTFSSSDGICVPLSGGLDSSTAIMLSVEAIGKDNVTGLFLQEKQGNHEADYYGPKLAKYLGIKTKSINMTKPLKKIGVYKSLVSQIPTRKLRGYLTKRFLERNQSLYKQGITNDMTSNDINSESKTETLEMRNELNFIEKLIYKIYLFKFGKKLHKNSKNSKSAIDRDSFNQMKQYFFNHGQAASNAKQRMRLVLTYKYCDENNLTFVGAAHRSEDYVGLFVKGGVDDIADIMPMKNLYRENVLGVAKQLGVLPEILERPPNPDVLAGVDDKYVDLLGVESEIIDLILYGLKELNLNSNQIYKELNHKKNYPIKISLQKVKEIVRIVQLSDHKLNPSYAPIIKM